jgi:bifunctional DNase/RNase
MAAMVECELTRIVLRDDRDDQSIYLREKGGAGRVLAIVIGRFEARAIDASVRKQRPPRPMTHDLLAATLDALGCRLDRVEIPRVEAGTFHATLHLRTDRDAVALDARPSDAVALAARTGAPVFVAEEVLREAAESPK